MPLFADLTPADLGDKFTVDPQALHWLGGAPVELDRTAVYSVAFFMFWVVLGLSGAITQLLLAEPADASRMPARRRFP